jgi:hypothetical protein
MILARFYVSEVTVSAHAPEGAAQVKLQAVSRGDQNRQWASATPSGQITMTINNEPAASYFRDRLGRDIEVAFKEVPVHTPGDGHPYRPSEAPPGTYYSAPKCGDCLGLEGEHASGSDVVS